MGTINCNSNKLKIEDHLNKKTQLNQFEQTVAEEFTLLKNLIEGKIKPTAVDQFFVLTNYKKKLSRLQKWINIAYLEIPENERLKIVEKARNSLNNEDNKPQYEMNQLDKLNNLLDDINFSCSLDSSVNNINLNNFNNDNRDNKQYMSSSQRKNNNNNLSNYKSVGNNELKNRGNV